MKFVVRRARRGRMRRNQWFWELVADNGEVLATSETYNNKGDALHTARLVRAYATVAETTVEAT